MKQFFLKDKVISRPADTVIEATCPACGTFCGFVPQNNDHDDLYEMCSEGMVVYGTRFCPLSNCRAVVFFRYVMNGGSEAASIYPPTGMKLKVESVPDEVREDAEEALRCFQVAAWKACTILCRRVIQVACTRNNAAGGNLQAQIEDLFAKQILPESLRDWAHQVRYFGNFAAHPDPAFGNVTEDDAATMINFMTNFLMYLYEMPAKVAAARQRSGRP